MGRYNIHHTNLQGLLKEPFRKERHTYNALRAGIPRKVFRPIISSWLWLKSLEKSNQDISKDDVCLETTHIKYFNYTGKM